MLKYNEVNHGTQPGKLKVRELVSVFSLTGDRVSQLGTQHGEIIGLLEK